MATRSYLYGQINNHGSQRVGRVGNSATKRFAHALRSHISAGKLYVRQCIKRNVDGTKNIKFMITPKNIS